jgi:pimeloyl-ACP methyl ester carboxylesterase
MTADNSTIVFVHGGWADATGFDGSMRTLRDRGFAVIGAANPLRHLTGDAASLTALLGTISGPIVLVGHSYGGAVISNAANGNEQVQALVFIAGWMPDEGESIQQLLEAEAFADSLVPAALRPVPFKNPDGSEGVDLYLDRELFPETFAADVDPETAAVMAATQRPWSGAAAATPSGPPGVAVHPLVVFARHRGPSDPAGGAAIHGRAWERADRRGGGLACVHGVPAGGRDAADLERRRGDQPQPAVRAVTAVLHRPARLQALGMITDGGVA